MAFGIVPISGAVLYPAAWSAGDIYGYGNVTDVVNESNRWHGLQYRDPTRAFVWTGPSGTFVNLTPPSAATAAAVHGTDGNQQVGFVNNDAMLWTGTAASAVDLNPSGFISLTGIWYC